MTDRLLDLRHAIDQIDEELLALIQKRMQLSREVMVAKAGGVIYRPGREAAVFDRLCGLAPDLPVQTIVNIWRQIMTASAVRQDRSIDIAVLQAALPTAHWHFGGLVMLHDCQNLNDLRARLGDSVPLAVVPTGDASGLADWLFDDPDWQIIAKTPFSSGSGLPDCYIIGREAADPAPREVTLVATRNDRKPTLIQIDGRHTPANLPKEMDGRIVGIIASSAQTD